MLSADALFAGALTLWVAGSIGVFCHRLFSRVLY